MSPRAPQPYDLTIIDINGFHTVRVLFCTCDTKTPWNERYRQLLRMRWYPASFSRPRTAFSFDLLETYHKLTLQGKINLYDFYLAIMQKSDNQGRSKATVSNQLQRILNIPDFLSESVSRNFTLYPPVEAPERRQTWGWCTPGARTFPNGAGVICD